MWRYCNLKKERKKKEKEREGLAYWTYLDTTISQIVCYQGLCIIYTQMHMHVLASHSSLGAMCSKI